jgi:2Fe-2S ferredoxin
MSENSSKIHFEPNGDEIAAKPQKTLLECALKAGIELLHSCGGMATCGTCMVIIESDLENLPPRNELESEMAQDKGFRPQERLACQLPAQGGLRIDIGRHPGRTKKGLV